MRRTTDPGTWRTRRGKGPVPAAWAAAIVLGAACSSGGDCSCKSPSGNTTAAKPGLAGPGPAAPAPKVPARAEPPTTPETGGRKTVSARAPAPTSVAKTPDNPCGLPEDYVPPWGDAPIPPEERVPGTIGGGALPVIGGCPPMPPGPDAPRVRAVDFAFSGTPYREPNRRVVLYRLERVRRCHREALRGDPTLAVTLDVTVELPAEGRPERVAVAGDAAPAALRACIRASLSDLSFYVPPDSTGARVRFRYLLAPPAGS